MAPGYPLTPQPRRADETLGSLPDRKTPGTAEPDETLRHIDEARPMDHGALRGARP